MPSVKVKRAMFIVAPACGDAHSVRSEMFSVASINMELLTEFDTSPLA